MALSAAFSMAMIIIGVANTCGSIASLNWLARCAGVTRSLNVPVAPSGIGRMRHYSSLPGEEVAERAGSLVIGATPWPWRELRGTLTKPARSDKVGPGTHRPPACSRQAVDRLG